MEPTPPLDPDRRPEPSETLPYKPHEQAEFLLPSSEREPAEHATQLPASHETGREDAAPLVTRSLVGYRFGDFEILAELGRGSMGVVYKARQQSLDRLVAVKLLLAQALQSPAVLARFLQEARVAASLDHPNIVKVYQVGECPAGHYFAMELLSGEPLDVALRRGPLAAPAAVALMIPLAEAVHHAHGRGVIHRDLKPANVMIDRLRRPVIMDFGLAKVLGQSAGLTQQGTVLGTPAYMAPELAGDDPSRVGSRTDVYSLGAILYAMLTGRPPYTGDSALSTIVKVIGPESPPPVCSLRPDLPSEVGQVCARCLAKKPQDRYATAQALAQDLQRLARRLASHKPAPAAPGPNRPALVLVSAKTGQQIRIHKPTTVIGRATGCDLALRSADVSKRHCQIRLEAGRAIVEDLGSANGTRVNGRPAEDTELCDGDQLDIAGHLFLVRCRLPEP